jgi:hypothetical protein
MGNSALFNPLSINIDDLTRVHANTEGAKYALGTQAILTETTLNSAGYKIKTINGVYIWLQSTGTFAKGEPFLIIPNDGAQAEVQANALLVQDSGAQVGFAQIDGVVAGKYFWAKVSGRIQAKCASGLQADTYVKVSEKNGNLESGNSYGTTFDDEVIGKTVVNESSNIAEIIVPPNRTIQIK